MNTLTDYLSADSVNEDAMYFDEMQGFLTSLAIVPGNLSQQQILTEILATENIDKRLSDAISQLQSDIEQSLLNGEFPDSSNEQGDEDSLTLWAAGFMQGVFMQEDLWFTSHPEEVAELTLPILSCSELLDDEMDDLSQNDELMDDMAEKIPDCIIDLYLLFNTPDSA
ncbi:MAG: metal-binding protein [Cycloclasticus sp.]|nr:MAG: metal-binding protein [Cycloclasticus sp.]